VLVHTYTCTCGSIHVKAAPCNLKACTATPRKRAIKKKSLERAIHTLGDKFYLRVCLFSFMWLFRGWIPTNFSYPLLCKHFYGKHRVQRRCTLSYWHNCLLNTRVAELQATTCASLSRGTSPHIERIICFSEILVSNPRFDAWLAWLGYNQSPNHATYSWLSNFAKTYEQIN
jgi:hypothetical protein